MTPLFADYHSVSLFGVVPVFVNTGAALLPAILAGLASVLGLLLKPREMFRLCLRRPWVPILVIAVAAGSCFVVPWLFGTADGTADATAPTDPRQRPNARAGSDWAAVALELIRQEQRDWRAAWLEERDRRVALEARVEQLEEQLKAADRPRGGETVCAATSGREDAPAAAGVQTRLLGAAFVPLAVVLGPMVMSLVWLPARVAPASWNPPPGAVAHVTAEVDGEHTGQLRLEATGLLALDEQTPAGQSPPPIRAVLSRLLARWRQEVKEPGGRGGKIPPAMMADLQRYLDGRIPPQQLTWTIHTPSEPGRHPIALVAGDGAPIRTSLVLGDRFPPEPKEDLGDGRGPLQVATGQADSPIRRVTVTYQFPRTLGDRVFFAPLKGIDWPTLEKWGWSRWDAGWLLTYIAAYLLTLLPVRWLLRIP